MSMPRGPVSFRQSDLIRCFRAAQAAGITIDRVEIDQKGNIVVVVNNGERPVVAAIADSRFE
jgi:hypothetical protein